MKNVTVYGSGCKNCTVTAEKLTEFARKNGLNITISKETDMMAIMQAGVMSTPAVAVDGSLVHTGSVPTDEQITQFFL